MVLQNAMAREQRVTAVPIMWWRGFLCASHPACLPLRECKVPEGLQPDRWNRMEQPEAELCENQRDHDGLDREQSVGTPTCYAARHQPESGDDDQAKDEGLETLMSYEGYKELLCGNGHYYTHDAYDDAPATCPHCGSHWDFFHPIDLTNGSDPDDPGTMPAPKIESGWDDIWLTDHYGNRYAIKRPKYRPDSEWQKKHASYVTPEYE